MTAIPGPLETVQALAPLVAEHADSIETERCLPKPVVRALIESGVFKLLAPRALGGAEADPITACRTLEELSRLDGSTGWCAHIAADYSLFGGLLPAEAAREIYSEPGAVVAGTFRRNGTARRVPGGYHVSGRWGFASGISHSTWTIGGFNVYDGDMPRFTASGVPEPRMLFFPTADAEIIDTWHVAGLRGTGSHDYAVNDLFVPERRAFWFSDKPVQPGPLYTLPAMALFVALMTSVTLGIARHAIDSLTELAHVKQPSGVAEVLRESPHAQARIGEAEGLLRAGRAFLYEAVEEAWDVALSGRHLTWEQRGLLWLSGVQATTQALQAVNLMFRAGGASSNFQSVPLERCLRDIRAASQHRLLQLSNFEVAGQFFLGFDMVGTAWGRDFRGDA